MAVNTGILHDYGGARQDFVSREEEQVGEIMQMVIMPSCTARLCQGGFVVMGDGPP